jgi:hypothetical protein
MYICLKYSVLLRLDGLIFTASPFLSSCCWSCWFIIKTPLITVHLILFCLQVCASFVIQYTVFSTIYVIDVSFLLYVSM